MVILGAGGSLGAPQTRAGVTGVKLPINQSVNQCYFLTWPKQQTGTARTLTLTDRDGFVAR